MIATIPQTHADYDLSYDNTMALSCIAKQAVILEDENQIEPLFLSLSTNNPSDSEKNTHQFLILSGGSNVILPNKLKKTAILPRYTGIQVIKQSEEFVDIEVMAGNNWHQLVVDCTTKGWYGLENLALIPGLVGASPVQNIGAYGVQLEDCLTHIKAFHIPTQTWQVLSKEEADFDYRNSIFKKQPNTWLISRVGFRLHKDINTINANYGDVQTIATHKAKQNGRNHPAPLDVMNAIIEIRQRKLPDPKQLANTGSFFQNPIITRNDYESLVSNHPDLPKYDIDEHTVKVPAGWLIDQAGLKGKGIAPILTHVNQALVLTNHTPQQATQTDIANTRDLIIRTVKEKFSIELHPEPVWIE